MPADNTIFLDFSKSVTLSVVLLDSKEQGIAIPSNNPVWSVDAPTLITLVPDGQTCVATANASLSGTAKVTCVITSPVGQTTTIKIVVGAPDPSPRLEIWGSPVKFTP